MQTVPLYTTALGQAIVGDSRILLDELPDRSVNLVMTSPPFALQREKQYGNVDQAAYVEWLCTFAEKVYRVLTEDGSFVLDLGGAYQRQRPVRSLYNYRVLIKLCDELGFHLAEEFFWYNPAKLPSPIEWVNKRKIRAKDAVNTVWWLSKTDFPKANIRNVLVPYSDRMKQLQADPARYYTPKDRPSGHGIGSNFGTDNGGAIPSNLLQIANTESNSYYLRACKTAGIAGHPARFPQKLPAFFIEFLTNPGDLVVDIFAGSNTTGAAAEATNRTWLSFEENRAYLAASAFRFLSHAPLAEAAAMYDTLQSTTHPIHLDQLHQTRLDVA
ncbi:modification methylase PvuII [Herpetosiphon gulosus]|uniref:Methyltransferase n=2 Tax=Herpetosiphon gulosus TaxID=1973496 RepID=A0ABP9X968_9CHLR